MMDDDAIVAQVLALLQQETGEQGCWVLPKRQAKESLAEHIPTLPGVCSSPIEYEEIS
jgi:hypothetical protein